MCKLFIVTNTAKLNRSKLIRLLDSVNTNISEQDGFGWTAINEKNELFGEKYVNPKLFDMRILRTVKDAPFNKKQSITFGRYGRLSSALLVHGRTSTNTVNMANTHPFIDSKHALIHNGVVNNLGDSYKTTTDCDTEHMLHYFSEGGMKAVEENLGGYYACGVLDRANKNLHVFKDATASLYTTYVSHLDSWVFATTQGLLVSVLNEMGWKYSQIDEMEDNIHLVFNSKGVLMEQNSITPRRGYVSTQLMNRSMGHSGKYWDDSNTDWQRWEEKFNERADVPSYKEEKDDAEYYILDGEEITVGEYNALSSTMRAKCVPILRAG